MILQRKIDVWFVGRGEGACAPISGARIFGGQVTSGSVIQSNRNTHSIISEELMRKFILILFAAMSISAFAADTTVKGYLVDLACATGDEGKEANFGAEHGKQCLQMPDCVKGGYGILTPDKRIVRIDKAGNDEAKKFITT